MNKPLITTARTGGSPSELQVAAEGVLIEMGQRLRRVLTAVAPGEAGPSDLERELGLHKTLGWRIIQVAYAREPLAVASHVPGDEGLEKFLVAALARGADAGDVEGVRQIAAQYRVLIKAHAGDRASFDVMLMGMATPEDTAVELKAARRAAYRSASYAWGVQTATRVLAVVVTPTGDDLVDIATIRGHVRARRVRREGVVRLTRTVGHDTDAPDLQRTEPQAIEPESVLDGVALLPRFCTQPLPPVTAATLPNHRLEYRFSEQPIGEQSAITVFTGEVRRGLSGTRWSTEANRTNAIMMTIRDPLGLGVIDLWAPPEFGMEHRALVVSAIGVDPQTQRPSDWHALPGSATVERMGRGLLAARLSEAPMYEDAVGHCFNRLGWAANNYELHRLRLEYPMIGSCLVLQTVLPERH